MSFSLSRDQFGKPLQKPIQKLNDPALLNQLADTKPAGSSKVTFTSLTIGDVSVDNTLVTKLAPTTGITEGTAAAGKAVVLDYSKSVSGINKIYVDSLYINGTLLNPNIFKGSAVAVSTNDAERAELTNITPGAATGSKALVLDSRGRVEGINKLSLDGIEVGNQITINRAANSIKMDNIDYFDRRYNKWMNIWLEKAFSNAYDIGFKSNESYGMKHYILENCYSITLGIHVAAFLSTDVPSNSPHDYSLGYSYDGCTWKRAITVTTVKFVNWFQSLNLFIGVGGNQIFTSTNGINWTVRTITDGINMNCIEYAEDKGLFVIGCDYRILYSNDLNGDWIVSDYILNVVNQIVYIDSTKRFIARTDTGQTSILVSNDGKKWIQQPTQFNGRAIQYICYAKSKNMIVMSAGSGRTYRGGFYSKDGGFTFYPFYSSQDLYGIFKKITFIPDYNLFLAVADDGSTRAAVSYSNDGVNWRGATLFYNSNDAGTCYSIVYDRKTSNLFFRTKDIFPWNRWQNFKVRLTPLNHTMKSYKWGDSGDKINLNSTDNKMLNIGSETGELIKINRNDGYLRTITLNNGILKYKTYNLNIYTNYIAKGTDRPLILNNLLYMNKHIKSPYYSLDNYSADQRIHKNVLKKIDANKTLNIPGYVKVNSLTVGGTQLNLENNINEFKGNKIGIAAANKFLIAKYGGVVTGANRVDGKSAVIGNYVLTSKENNTNVVVNLNKKHGLVNKGAEYIFNPFKSYLYNSSDAALYSNFFGTPVTTDRISYIKETGMLLVRRSIWLCMGLNDNNILQTSFSDYKYLMPFSGIDNIIFVKELQTYYGIGSNGIVFSKDCIAWNYCNMYSDVNANCSTFAYSPLLDTIVVTSNNKVQMSKNGVDFRNISELRYGDKFSSMIWVDSWAMFVAVCATNNSTIKQYVYSIDGQTWNLGESQEETLYKNATTPSTIAYSPKLDMAIVFMSTTIKYTYDGKMWYTTRFPHSNFGGYVSWIKEMDIFVASSSSSANALLYYSYNGLDWNVLKTPTSLTGVSAANNSEWFYINRMGVIANTVNSGTAGLVVLKVNSSQLNNMHAVNEDNSTISLDYINNRLGLGVESPQFSLHLGEDMAFKPSSTFWTTSSDERLKEDIQPADTNTCYENVKNIPLKKFKWKDSVYGGREVNHTRQIGWIAQDVEERIPKAVDRKNMHGIEDCRTLNNDQIIANMYGAVKQLMKMDKEMDEYFE